MLRAYYILYYTLENAGHATKLNIYGKWIINGIKTTVIKNRDIGTTRPTPYPQKKRSGMLYAHI